MSIKRSNSESDFDIIDRSSIPSHDSVVKNYVKPFLTAEEKAKQRNSGNFFTRFFDRQQIKDEERKKGRHLTDKEMADIYRKQINMSTSASNHIYSPSNKSRSEASRRQGGRSGRRARRTRVRRQTLVKRTHKNKAKTQRKRK